MRVFIGALRAMVQADVTGAEGKFHYACFRDELRSAKCNRLYKAFDQEAKAMAAPSIGRSR